MVGGMRLVNPTSSVPPTTTGKGKVSQQEVSRRVVSIDRLLQVVVEKMSSFEEGQKNFSRLFIKKMGEQTKAISQLANVGKKNEEIEKKRIEEEQEKDYDKLESKTDKASNKQEKTSLLGSKGIGGAINAGMDKAKTIGMILSFAIPAIAAVVNFIVKKFDTIKKFWEENVTTPLLDGVFWVKDKIEESWESITEFWQEKVTTPLVDSIFSLKDKFESAWETISKGFEDFIDGVMEGIKSALPEFLREKFFGPSREGVGAAGNRIESNSAVQQEKFKEQKKKDESRLDSGIVTSSGTVATTKDNENFGENLASMLPGGENNYLYKTAKKESSLGKNIVSGSGTARGMFQINEGTTNLLLKKFGGEGGPLQGYTLEDRYDPEKSLKMAQVLDEDNRKILAGKLGKDSPAEITDKEARMAYFLGADRGAEFIKAMNEGEQFVPTEKELSQNTAVFAGKSTEQIWQEQTGEYANENTVSTEENKRIIAANLKSYRENNQLVAASVTPPINQAISAPSNSQQKSVPPETPVSQAMAAGNQRQSQTPVAPVVVADSGSGRDRQQPNVSSSSNVTNYNVMEVVAPGFKMMEARTYSIRGSIA